MFYELRHLRPNQGKTNVNQTSLSSTGTGEAGPLRDSGGWGLCGKGGSPRFWSAAASGKDDNGRANWEDE